MAICLLSIRLFILFQSTTIRENICFGREFDSEKVINFCLSPFCMPNADVNQYWNAIRCACLEPDLETFPNGDLTEVGERVSLFITLISISVGTGQIGYHAFGWTETTSKHLSGGLFRHRHTDIRCESIVDKNGSAWFIKV